MKEISVIVPTYNERKNIKALLENLIEILQENFQEFEIIVVDDNSPDGTWREVLNLNSEYVRLIRRPKKLGLASAILEGILNSRYEYCIVLDADGQHIPEEIPKLAKYLGKYDLVIGSRYVSGGKIENWNPIRRFISEIATKATKLLFDIKVNDPLSGFFGLKKEIVYEETNWKLYGYKFLLEVLIKKAGNISVKEVGITFKSRQYGKSKLNCIEILNYLGLIFSYSRFLKYSLVGLSGLLVSEFFLWFYHSFLEFSLELAGVFAIFLAILNNFVWNEKFVFSDRRYGSVLYRYFKFVSTRIFGFVTNYAILLLLTGLGLHYLISNAIGVIFAFIINYLTAKFVVWNRI